jgi:lysophospholipase L1-like esterase
MKLATTLNVPVFLSSALLLLGTASPRLVQAVAAEQVAPPQAAPPQAAQNSAIVPAPFQPQRHAQFLEIAAKGDIDCLLMGDSITDWWQRAGAEVYTKNFSDLKCANFGIAGDRTQGVLWRMENGELEGYTPKAMMLMIGTNNLGGGRGGAGNTPEQIAAGIKAIVDKFHAKFPAAKVLLLGVFPRCAQATSSLREPIKQINTIIAKLDDGNNVKFMDIGARFLEADGTISTTVMGDGLHPTARGYEIWAEAVMPTFRAMLGK